VTETAAVVLAAAAPAVRGAAVAKAVVNYVYNKV
jgi:hypothetical protein